MIDVKDFGLARAQGIQLVSTEWFFSGKTEMHSDNDRFECQNCNHPELGKSYEIKKGNGIILWVCSKCMLDLCKNAFRHWKEAEIVSEIERAEAIYTKDRRRKERRKVTAPLMEAFPDVFSQDFMFSRNDGYSAYDIFLFKTYAKLIGVPMDVTDFDISSRTDELRNSIERIPKPLFDEIREALPDEWQTKLERHFKEGRVESTCKFKSKP